MGSDHTGGGIPIATAPNRRKPTSFADYRSQCKRCRCAILAGHPAVWQRRPLIGLVHARCAEGES